jgi:hypothetical protein
MLSSPVYTEAHPLRNTAFAFRKNLLDAVHAASRPSSVFSNPFRSHLFRTLAAHVKATASPNSFLPRARGRGEIKRFRTLRKIPGIGYPLTLSTFRDGRVSTFSPSLIPPQSLPVIQPFRFQSLTGSFAQWSAATPVFSDASGLFPSPWGCIPPIRIASLQGALPRENSTGALLMGGGGGISVVRG